MPEFPFELLMPENWSTGVVFASPHSGSDYPRDLMAKTDLGEAAIRSSEDCHVDQLFQAAPEYGAPLLRALMPRAYVDLNRSEEELDPAVIDGLPAGTANPRVASGLGVIPRVVSNGRAIYRGKITVEEARKRLRNVWHPYHNCLADLLRDCLARFGSAVLIDCHSMPHEAVDNFAKGSKRPDIVLGDRFGAAADNEIMEVIESAFAETGLVVARNTPFAGAYIAQTYGRPSRKQHVVQIEIDRSLYMNEATLEKRTDFVVMQQAITHVIASITEYGSDRLPLAAE